MGLLLNCVAGAVLAAGLLIPGGFLVLIAGLFDTLDGALARATNRKTNFGAFFDSSMDRFSEAVCFLGLAVAYMRLPELTGGDARYEVLGVALCFASMIGSIMVSYARARAEGLIPRVDCEVGWLQRPERIVILGFGVMLPTFLPPESLLLVLGVLAVLTHITVAQRVGHVRRETDGGRI
jgi:CDP-diacylglycerol---glycerol-3-phosphate 3-phosphatidyltransferase